MPGIEIDLDDDRHREQRDDERLPHDLLALKAEQQHQRRQQRDERYRLQPPQGARPAPPRRRARSSARRHSCAAITGTTM